MKKATGISLMLSAYFFAGILPHNAVASETQNKSSPQRSATQTKSKKWDQQPTSFMGVEFNQPLSKSVQPECPINDRRYGNTTLYPDDIKNLETLCVGTSIVSISKRGTYNVLGFKVSPIFDEASITTLNNNIDGPLGRFYINFLSVDFSSVKDMLVLKFGKPHVITTEKVKTNGGVEFKNSVLKWSGDNVIITLESLAERGVYENSGSIYEYGSIKIVTLDFLKKLNNEETNKVVRGAAGL